MLTSSDPSHDTSPAPQASSVMGQNMQQDGGIPGAVAELVKAIVPFVLLKSKAKASSATTEKLDAVKRQGLITGIANWLKEEIEKESSLQSALQKFQKEVANDEAANLNVIFMCSLVLFIKALSPLQMRALNQHLSTLKRIGMEGLSSLTKEQQVALINLISVVMPDNIVVALHKQPVVKVVEHISDKTGNIRQSATLLLACAKPALSKDGNAYKIDNFDIKKFTQEFSAVFARNLMEELLSKNKIESEKPQKKGVKWPRRNNGKSQEKDGDPLKVLLDAIDELLPAQQNSRVSHIMGGKKSKSSPKDQGKELTPTQRLIRQLVGMLPSGQAQDGSGSSQTSPSEVLAPAAQPEHHGPVAAAVYQQLQSTGEDAGNLPSDAVTETKPDIFPLLSAIFGLAQELSNQGHDDWVKAQAAFLVEQLKEQRPNLFKLNQVYINLAIHAIQHGDQGTWDIMHKIVLGVEKLVRNMEECKRLIAQLHDLQNNSEQELHRIKELEEKLKANRIAFYEELIPLTNLIIDIIERLGKPQNRVILKTQLENLLRKLPTDIPLLQMLIKEDKNKEETIFSGLYDKKDGLHAIVSRIHSNPDGCELLADTELNVRRIRELKKSGPKRERNFAILDTVENVASLALKLDWGQQAPAPEEAQAQASSKEFLLALTDAANTAQDGQYGEYFTIVRHVINHGRQETWVNMKEIVHGVKVLLLNMEECKGLTAELYRLRNKVYRGEDLSEEPVSIEQLEEGLRVNRKAFYEEALKIADKSIAVLNQLGAEDFIELIQGLLDESFKDNPVLKELVISKLGDKAGRDMIGDLVPFLKGNLDHLVEIELNARMAGNSIATLKARRFEKEFTLTQRRAAKRDMYMASFAMVQRLIALFKGLDKEKRKELLTTLLDQGLKIMPPKIPVKDNEVGLNAADGEEVVQDGQQTIRELEEEELNNFKDAVLAIVDVAVAEKGKVDDLMNNLKALINSGGLKKDADQIKRVIDNVIEIVVTASFVEQHNDHKNGIKLFWQAINGIIEGRLVKPSTGNEPRPTDVWGEEQLKEDKEFGRNLQSVLGSFASLIEKSVEQQREQEHIAQNGVQNGGGQLDQNREEENVEKIADKIKAVVDSLFEVVFQVQPQQHNQNAYIRTNEFYNSLITAVNAIANAVKDKHISEELDSEFFGKFAGVLKVVSAGRFAEHASLFTSLPAVLQFYRITNNNGQGKEQSVDEIRGQVEKFINSLRRHLVPQVQGIVAGIEVEAQGAEEPDIETLAQNIADNITTFLSHFKVDSAQEIPDHIKRHATHLAKYIDFLVSNLDENTRWGKALKNLLTIPEGFLPDGQVGVEGGAAANANDRPDAGLSNNIKLYLALILKLKEILRYLHVKIGYKTGLTIDGLLGLFKDPSALKVGLYSAKLLDKGKEIKADWRKLGYLDLLTYSEEFSALLPKVWELTKLSTTILANVGRVVMRANGILVDLSSQKAKQEVSSTFIILMLFVTAARLSSYYNYSLGITNVSTISLTLGITSASVSWLVLANFVQWRSVLDKLGVLNGEVVQPEESRDIIDSLRDCYNSVANYLHPVGVWTTDCIAQRLSDQTQINLRKMQAKITNVTNTAYNHCRLFKENFMAYSPEAKIGIGFGVSLSLTLLFHVIGPRGSNLYYLLACTTGALGGALHARNIDYSRGKNLDEEVLLRELIAADQAEVNGAHGVSAEAQEEGGRAAVGGAYGHVHS
jgi:hypothetical protein